jgi:hypothetical protein
LLILLLQTGAELYNISHNTLTSQHLFGISLQNFKKIRLHISEILIFKRC